jgi:hypothetical protein
VLKSKRKQKDQIKPQPGRPTPFPPHSPPKSHLRASNRRAAPWRSPPAGHEGPPLEEAGADRLRFCSRRTRWWTTRRRTRWCRGATPPTQASWSGTRPSSRRGCCPPTSSTATSPASSASSTPTCVTTPPPLLPPPVPESHCRAPCVSSRGVPAIWPPFLWLSECWGPDSQG